MSNRSHSKSEIIESSIPNWVLYALLTVISLLIAKSIHGAVVALTAAGILAMFALFYMSKPAAEIQTIKEKNNNDQLNMFHKRYKIEKKYSDKKALPTEPSGQRRRYLKTLEEDGRRAA